MSEDQLSVTFAALADPTRRAILARPAEGKASVTELAKPFDLSHPGVSKHLKVLQRAGLITQSRNAQWRPCRLEGGRLKEASDWVGDYRRFWDESFQRLDDVLQDLIKGERPMTTKGVTNMPKTEYVIEPGKQEIKSTTLLDAPRELVFKAYTDPKLFVQWWGPRG